MRWDEHTMLDWFIPWIVIQAMNRIYRKTLVFDECRIQCGRDPSWVKPAELDWLKCIEIPIQCTIDIIDEVLVAGGAT